MLEALSASVESQSAWTFLIHMLAVGLHQLDVSVDAHWDNHQRQEAKSDYIRNLHAKHRLRWNEVVVVYKIHSRMFDPRRRCACCLLRIFMIALDDQTGSSLVRSRSISVLVIDDTFCLFNLTVYVHNYTFPRSSCQNPPIEK